MNPATANLLYLLLDMVGRAPAVIQGFAETKALIDKMVAEGRDPTPEEVAELARRSVDADQIFDDIRRRLAAAQ